MNNKNKFSLTFKLTLSKDCASVYFLFSLTVDLYLFNKYLIIK